MFDRVWEEKMHNSARIIKKFQIASKKGCIYKEI